MKKKRFLEFDILRGFAFLFVVVQHTFGGYSKREDISNLNFFSSKLIYSPATIGVPIFVFLTGLGLYYSYRDKLDIKDFYIKKIKYIILPYIFFSLFLLYLQDAPINSDIIWNILSGSTQYHLCYMTMIIRMYLFFPLIYYIIKFINKQNKYISSLSFILFYILYSCLLNSDKVTEFIKSLFFKNPGKLQVNFSMHSPLLFIQYLVLGIFTIKNYDCFKKIILKYKYFVICTFILLFIQNYYLCINNRIGNPLSFIIETNLTTALYELFTILIMYLASYYISVKLKYLSKSLIFISKYSYPAYLMHVYILNKFSCSFAITNEISCISKLFILTCISSLFISFILSYLPFSKYIIGCHCKLNLDWLSTKSTSKI